MTYIKTKLQREIVIDSIITLHYFEYMKDFVFRGESHDFWEFLYVDKGTVSVCSGDHWLTLNAGDIVFHKPNEFHAIKSIGKNSPNLVVVSFTTSSPAIRFLKTRAARLTRMNAISSHSLSRKPEMLFPHQCTFLPLNRSDSGRTAHLPRSSLSCCIWSFS